MNAESAALAEMVDLTTYPLHETGSPALQQVLEQVHTALAAQGCSVLSGFIRPDVLTRLEAEGQAVAGQAYYQVETVNAYNISPDTPLPPDHPARLTFERGNAFVARDLLPTSCLIHQLYVHPLFQRFIADCFQVPQIYELADPLSGLCLNVLQPGKGHPWHFDINEFTVSLLTKPAAQGGVFEYCPNIRSPDDENFAAVRRVLMNEPDVPVRPLDLQCGDLQLFRGRHALHRVTEVEGTAERHTAIFAYTREPGVIGKVARTRQLFGRVLPEHYAAERDYVRSDTLMD